MRILTYLPELAATGGVEQHLLQLSRELARRGHEIDLRCTTDGELGGEFRSFCSSVVEGPSIRYAGAPVGNLARIALQARAAARTRPDLVYVNNFSEILWAMAGKTITRAPIVSHLHAFEFTQFARYRSHSARVLGNRPARFIISSEFMRAAWADYVTNPAKLEVIPYGIQLSDYPKGTEPARQRSRTALGLPPDAYVVLYLGRLDPEKGVEVLLAAWKLLAASDEQARLLLVGSPMLHRDPAAYLEQLQRDAPPGCHWLPMRPDVVSAMHAADVLVLPSVWDEPFGRVVIETMATGRPVVASRSGGIPEILTGRFAQFLFERGDATGLAVRLGELREWRREQPELADQCVRHVAERFTLGHTADRIEAVFREALSAG